MNKSLLLSLLLVFVLSLVGFGCAQDKAKQAKEENATKAALSWLKMVDAAKYDESWDAAAQNVKEVLTKTRWRDSLQAALTPIGKLVGAVAK